jgi:hypothetical protein
MSKNLTYIDDTKLTAEEKEYVDNRRKSDPNYRFTEEARKSREKNASAISESNQYISQASGFFANIGASQNETEKQQEQEKLRINKQAYLMFNWKQFTDFSKSESNRFKSIGLVDHDNPAELNNILFKRQPKFDILLNSKSVDLSYFIPKVRLFKEYAGSSPNEVVDIELPIYQQYSNEDFNSIFQNKEGRGGGVGLKSFKWTTIGNSPGNQFSFGAEIELFFESLAEISKIRNTHPIYGPTTFEDLLILKRAPGRNPQGAVYDHDYYRVKALIGWHIPRGNNHPVPQEMIKELEQSNLSLYLGLNSHEIDIADDSTVTLKLKYIAYVEALMDSPKNSNIFYPKEPEKSDELIKQSRSNIEGLRNELQGSGGNPPVEGTAKQQKENDINTIEKNIEQEQLKNKTEAYERILSYIYNNNLIRFTTLNQEVFKAFMDIVSKYKDNLKSVEQINSYTREMEAISQRNQQANSTNPTGILPSISSDKTSIEVPTSQEGLGQNFAKTVEAANASLPQAATDGSIVVPFFFLGDLIESIVSDMYNGGNNGNVGFLNKQVKLILGPMVFFDYGRLTDNVSGKPLGLSTTDNNGNKQVVQNYTGTKTVVNIADIPIALDTFTTWFTKKIVDAGVVNMSIRQFIDLILNDLVIRSLGVEAYSFAPRQKARLVYKTKTLKRNNNRFSSSSTNSSPASISQAISTGTTSIPSSNRFQATQVKLYDEDMGVEEQSIVDNYIVIYGISNNAFELQSNYEEDIKKGIRHVAYGSETGLIKTIKFNRQDNPLIRSHNMKMASKEGSGNGIILREVYNANVEMYGNSLFEIGELIYVIPSLFGPSTVNTKKGIVDSISFAKDLGIGGYFMILKINNSIEDGKYTTSLDLVWNAKGDGIANNVNDGILPPTSDRGVKIQ